MVGRGCLEFLKLVNSEFVELDLERIAILSKKASCWHQAVCCCPFLWEPCPQSFGSAWCLGFDSPTGGDGGQEELASFRCSAGRSCVRKLAVVEEVF